MRVAGQGARPASLLTAAVFGALAALALPPITFFPILLICVPALLGMVASAPSRKRAYWLGYAFGFAHTLFGIYWITEAILIEAASYWWLVPFAVPMLAAVLANLTALPCLIAWHARTPGQRALLLAGAWVLSDLARQFIATGFPWNLWGSSLELPGLVGNVLIQPAALIGIHGMTLAVMLLASTPTLSWRWRSAGAAFAACWLGFGVWRLHLPEPKPAGVNVVMVQGNVPEGQKSSRAAAVTVFQHYLALSRAALAQTDGPKVLIWPETASPFLLGEDPAAREAIADAAGPDTVAMVGAIRFDGQVPYNSLFVLSPGPQIAAIYDKWHLVPFGEYQPSWLPGIQLIPGSFGFGPGPRTLRVSTPGNWLPPFGPLICYEAVFTGQIIQHGNRPSWLVAVTNDAWFGDSSGPRQHLAAARLRAVEEGMPLMRAANTGITAGFDAKGRELGRLGLDRAGTLILPLPGALPPTWYSHLGLIAPLGLSVVCLIFGYIPTRMRVGRSTG
jgi:apolipoprotein N-acyltransferase